MDKGTQVVSRWIVNDTPATVTRVLTALGMIEIDCGEGELLLVRTTDYIVA